MKGSPNYENCMELVKWILNNDDGGAAGYFTQMVGFGPTDSAVHAKLASDVVARLPNRDNERAAWMNARWWGDNLAAVSERHKLWLDRLTNPTRRRGPARTALRQTTQHGRTGCAATGPLPLRNRSGRPARS